MVRDTREVESGTEFRDMNGPPYRVHSWRKLCHVKAHLEHRSASRGRPGPEPGGGVGRGCEAVFRFHPWPATLHFVCMPVTPCPIFIHI